MTTSSASRTLAWLRQLAKLWALALFCILVVYIFREVVLPFLFAILVAYILAPLVARSGRVRIGGGGHTASRRRAAVPALGGRHHSLRLHPQRARVVHRVFRAQAVGRLRPAVPGGAAAV